MKGKQEKTQKVFVNPEGLAVIKCPACERERPTRVDPSQIRGKALRENCMVRCTCQTKFAVKLEFRRDARKDSNLGGEFVSLPKGKPRGKVTVVNVSKRGIGLQIVGANQFKIGDEILILFTLDDDNHSLIEKSAVIRYVKGNYIGCEFIGAFPLGKALGSYLARESPKKDRKVIDDDPFDWSTRVMG